MGKRGHNPLAPLEGLVPRTEGGGMESHDEFVILQGGKGCCPAESSQLVVYQGKRVAYG